MSTVNLYSNYIAGQISDYYTTKPTTYTDGNNTVVNQYDTDSTQTPAFAVQLSEQTKNGIQNSIADSEQSNNNETDSELRTADGRKPTKTEETSLKQEVAEYSQTDRHVHNHEAAHMAAGGQFAGAATYSYKKGPDGKMYAVSGEVSLDMSEEDDPKKTLVKAKQLQRAALAPADPSAQDLSVASNAAAIQQKASADIRKSSQESSGTDNTATNSNQYEKSKFSIYKNTSDYSRVGQAIDIAASKPTLNIAYMHIFYITHRYFP